MNHRDTKNSGKLLHNYSAVRDNPRPLIFIAGLLMLLMAGCISTSSEPEIVATRLVPTAVPVVFPETFNVEAGALLFTENCAPCHGGEGLGDGPTASAFSCTLPVFPERRADVAMEDWYDTVANGNGGETDCLMPPWSNRLTSEQMWDVTVYAYQLRYQSNLVEGAEVLASRRTEDALPEFLGETKFQAETTDAELINLLHQNQVAGYSIEEQFAEDDQLLVLAYLRGLVYEQVPEVASNPVPQVTEEPGVVAATEESTAPENPVTQTTPEPGDATPAPQETTGTFTINGMVVNGTAGSQVPADLTLDLRVAAINATTNEPEEIYTAETKVNENGQFVFADIPLNPRSVALIQTEYAGIRQSAPEVLPGSLASDAAEVNFIIYETTSDAAVLTLESVATLVDAVTEENASLTYQFYEFVNTSDRIFISEDDTPDEYALELPLPEGATGPQAQSVLVPQGENTHQPSGEEPNTFEIGREDNRFVIQGDVVEAMLPGWVNRIFISYNYAYEGSMEITQAFAYDVAEVAVYVAMTRGLELESDQLIAAESITFSDNPYIGFTLAQAPLTAGTPLIYRVFDGPQAAATVQSSTDEAEEGSFLNDNAAFILGLGVFLLIAGGMFLFYDLQKTRLATTAPDSTGSNALPVGKQALIAEIAALDEAYEAGKISEERYQRRREALKEALRQVMGE